MKKSVLVLLAAVGTLAFSFKKEASYAVFEQASENYLLLKDSNLVTFRTALGSPADMELRANGNKLVKAGDAWMVPVTDKNDVTLTLNAIHSGKQLYEKKFRVYSNLKEIKKEVVTNTLDRFTQINRKAVPLKAGTKNKFVYHTNTTVTIACEGGTVSDINPDNFCVSPNKGVARVKVRIKDTFGELSAKEYLVVK